MDSESMESIIEKIPVLKFKYLGTYAANFIPPLLRNTFCIVNIDRSSSEGSHWVMLGNKNGIIYYGDSLGQSISTYGNIKLPYGRVKTLVKHQIQKLPLCGYYCIYFAWSVFKGVSVPEDFGDIELLKFIYKF